MPHESGQAGVTNICCLTGRKYGGAFLPQTIWLIALNRNDVTLGEFEQFAQSRPLQELRNAVDLIVVATVRKSEQFEQKAVEPFALALGGGHGQLRSWPTVPPFGRPYFPRAFDRLDGSCQWGCHAVGPARATRQAQHLQLKSFRHRALPPSSPRCAVDQDIEAEREKRRAGNSPIRRVRHVVQTEKSLASPVIMAISQLCTTGSLGSAWGA